MYLDHDVLLRGWEKKELSMQYRLAPGVGWCDFRDGFVVVRDRTTLRFPTEGKLVERFFSAMSGGVSPEHLTQAVPEVDAIDLAERLISAGVLTTYPARRRTHTPGLAATFDYALTENRALHIGVESDDEALASVVRSALTEAEDVTTTASELADVIFLVSSAPAELSKMAVAAWTAQRPHLPLSAPNGRAALIGPLALPPVTACYTCLRLRNSGTAVNADDYWALTESPAFVRRWKTEDLALAARVGVRLIKRAFVSRDDDAVGHATSLNLTDLTMYTSRVWSVPRCPTCSAIETYSTSYPWLRPDSSATDS
ncbi:TOMM precursor leader peptide-binding protein [Microbacterium trichothecenolyticum]|uniref:Bacteriocin biosynthesis cyclodehydratase domain-containing protein n=1 Tax=Microbacterium trichothecenolyticum TaxID=69370 RepID=A0ABU0TQZ1_MICTR|nr:TOMM precursor leader peptide-binding protein [Microbacterium trichothecenolyticum]MDQ1122086.1 bacteriocin biosynthesis cyclodehydratase domain-containing protein [Microbacterium trichothecenolyticum]